MRIVVLDGGTLNPGDLSWDELRTLGQCAVYDRTPPEQTVERARDAEIILVNKAELSAETLGRLARLRYIGVTATGHNIVDVEAARRRGVPVTNVPTYGTPSVAQMVFAHLLNLAARLCDHTRAVAEGRWCRSADFCFWDFPLVELAGMTMGIVGFGRIGRAVARIADALGMEVLAHDPAAPSDVPDCVAMVPLDDLFRRSDVVSLHCPLTPQTERLVNRERLARMKPGAYLINTARGPLVDEPALAEALRAGRIAGAGLDVLGDEPPPSDDPLLGAPNCFITPHIAWATRAARERMLSIAVENVRAFLAGKPQNVVNA